MPWTRSPPLLAKLAYAATGTVQLPPMRRTNARSASRAALVGLWSMARIISSSGRSPLRASMASVPWPASGTKVSAGKSSWASAMRPSLARPAAATTTPSHSGPPTLPTRVPTLPRMGTTSMSGRMDFSSAVRLGLPVPILAPGGSSDSGVAHLSMSASLGSCRGTLPAMTRPSGSSLARSLALCTARSMSPFSSAISISLANAPLPRLTRAASFLRSPPVVMGVTSKTAEGKPSLRRETTSSACARARGLPRVPIRYLADMAGQPGRSTHRRGLPRRRRESHPHLSPLPSRERRPEKARRGLPRCCVGNHPHLSPLPSRERRPEARRGLPRCRVGNHPHLSPLPSRERRPEARRGLGRCCVGIHPHLSPLPSRERRPEARRGLGRCCVGNHPHLSPLPSRERRPEARRGLPCGRVGIHPHLSPLPSRERRPEKRR